jgi:GTP cyclohydrolase I
MPLLAFGRLEHKPMRDDRRSCGKGTTMNMLAGGYADPTAAHVEATSAHLGEDLSRPGLPDTAKRFAKAMRFRTGGYSLDPAAAAILSDMNRLWD